MRKKFKPKDAAFYNAVYLAQSLNEFDTPISFSQIEEYLQAHKEYVMELLVVDVVKECKEKGEQSNDNEDEIRV